ncbi:hypothetical protein GCK72_011051 [Caenorhabditis remanei]|uniref:Uncharacterized protein n=1 Tax=Caenorhabditis remanei TaxID=31234 RepID=A0A6A5H4Z6_CAERE|nr:hypothetical protein GCK72_011051 [Caenorhabditis remanei]KAF1762788.1 hypothetical protein GCK72_011051 [Caenorhabditis remanei]
MIRLILFFIFPSIIHCCLVVKSVEPPKCECPYLALDKYNIQSHKAGQNWYESNPTDVLLLPPKIQVDDCSITVQCSEEDYSLRIFGGKRNYDGGSKFRCEKDDKGRPIWEVARDGEDKVRFKSYYLYATCINRDLGGVKPPSGTGVCYCDHAFLDPDSQNGDKLMNFDTRIEEHSERCEWYLYCRYPTNIARTVINGKIVKSKSFNATCNADTKLWSITNNGEVFENQPVFYHDCVEL